MQYTPKQGGFSLDEPGMQTCNSFVYVVDSDARVQQSVEAIAVSGGWSVRTFSTAEVFLATVDQGSTGCVITELGGSRISAEDLLGQFQARNIRLPVIIYTGAGDIGGAVRLMKLGVFDFVEKPASPVRLLEVIRAAMEKSSPEPVNSGDCCDLTSRERIVLEMLCVGKPTKLIAYELSISVKTVEQYRARLMLKYEAGNVAELVYRAVSGWRPTRST